MSWGEELLRNVLLAGEQPLEQTGRRRAEGLQQTPGVDALLLVEGQVVIGPGTISIMP